MGNIITRVINYIFPEEEIVFSRELQINLPVTQNDIYKENKNINNNNENEIIWII